MGEYNNWKYPKTPVVEKRRYRNNPTTTGGNPIKAFITTTTISFPKKFFMARKLPIGNEIMHEIITAENETNNDKIMISNKLESNNNIKSKAFIKDDSIDIVYVILDSH